LATNIVVQIWGCETGLVSRIEDCAVECGIAASDVGRKHHIQAFDEGLWSTGKCNQGVDVVMGVEVIFPR
jgi:hypothetical protein